VSAKVEGRCAQNERVFSEKVLAVIDIQKRFERLTQDIDKAIERASRGLPTNEELSVRSSAIVELAACFLTNIKPEYRANMWAQWFTMLRPVITEHDAEDAAKEKPEGVTTH
jgi:hypothetical protein